MSWGLFIIPYFTEAALYSYLIQINTSEKQNKQQQAEIYVSDGP